MTQQAPGLLAAILASVRRQLQARREREPLAVLERRAAEREPRAAQFVEALSAGGRINVIAECKRRSPSRGVLVADYAPVAIARDYQAGGAAAISVLTEPTFFDGHIDHLQQVRAAVSLPVLRKDFVVDEYQLLEARAGGADAVLLIAAALDRVSLAALHRRAGELGLAALVEAHDREEVAAAVDCGAAVIGINNRDLRTLSVDPAAALELAEALPASVVAVAESGLRSREEILVLRAAGYDAFLIGERLMTAENPGAAVRGLLEGISS
jgi:indole-3-glycerol phosphate synthase